MRILDQRNFYSSKKLSCLGEWKNQTVLLEQTEQPEPFFRILLFSGEVMEQSRFRTPLRGRVLRQCRLENGKVSVLLSQHRLVQVLTFALDSEDRQQEPAEFAFCGEVADACLAGEGCFVQIGSDEENELLYRELRQMTGRSEFLFYCEPQSGVCIPVQDFRLADLPPKRITIQKEDNILYGLYSETGGAEDADEEPPRLRSCVIWAQWERLHAALLRGELALPLQIPLSAEPDEEICLLGCESGTCFFSVGDVSAQALFALRLADGKSSELARTERRGESFCFVQGMGCCRVNKDGGRICVQPLNSKNALVLPERVGVPATWLEERYLLAHSGENAICYDTQRRESAVYEGATQFLPDGLLLS